jgi:hypothetical protein
MVRTWPSFLTVLGRRSPCGAVSFLIQDSIRYAMLDMLDIRCWMLDARYWMDIKSCLSRYRESSILHRESSIQHQPQNIDNFNLQA